MRLFFTLLLISAPSFAQQKAEVQFPSTDEINLVVSQAERAFEQYKNSVLMEKTLESSKRDPTSLKKDEEVVEMSQQLVAGLKKNPNAFHGLGGLLLLSSLDDASRNAALCSSAGSTEIAKGLIEHADPKDAYQIMTVIQNCSDTSIHLYTVSESVHALMVRELEAQEDLNNKAMDMVTKCTQLMKDQGNRK
jgi:hypothetical protein